MAEEEVDPFALENFSREKWDYSCRFDVDTWYQSLAEVTYKTVWFSVSPFEGDALCSTYSSRELGKPSKSPEEDEKYLKDLAEKIHHSIEENGWTESGVFVRLSTRSPKDVGMEGSVNMMGTPEWNHLLLSLPQGELLDEKKNETQPSEKGKEEEKEEEEEEEKVDSESRKTLNEKLRALMILCGRKLVVKTGSEAVDLLTRSERVFRDLHTARETEKKGWEWRMKVVIREWADVDPELEFRCFVSKGRLVACSQYNDMLYYPHINTSPSFQELIVEKILICFEEVRSKISHDLYVIDFAIQREKSKKETAIVVELNPAGPITGASCFQWDQDRAILTSDGSLDFDNLPPPPSDVTQRVINGVVFRCRNDFGGHLPTWWGMFVEDLQRSCKLREKKKREQQERQKEKELALTESTEGSWIRCQIL